MDHALCQVHNTQSVSCMEIGISQLSTKYPPTRIPVCLFDVTEICYHRRYQKEERGLLYCQPAIAKLAVELVRSPHQKTEAEAKQHLGKFSARTSKKTRGITHMDPGLDSKLRLYSSIFVWKNR